MIEIVCVSKVSKGQVFGWEWTTLNFKISKQILQQKGESEASSVQKQQGAWKAKEQLSRTASIK